MDTPPCLTETEEGYEIHSSDDSVTRCLVDYQFTLLFGETNSCVVIESEFVLEDEGETFRLDPEDLDSIAPALRLLRKTIDACRVDHHGTLHMKFVDGARVRVAASSRYEAWGITGGNGLKLVCMPGGEVAVWKPTN